jgi:hypothetical protein
VTDLSDTKLRRLRKIAATLSHSLRRWPPPHCLTGGANCAARKE